MLDGFSIVTQVGVEDCAADMGVQRIEATGNFAPLSQIEVSSQSRNNGCGISVRSEALLDATSEAVAMGLARVADGAREQELHEFCLAGGFDAGIPVKVFGVSRVHIT